MVEPAGKHGCVAVCEVVYLSTNAVTRVCMPGDVEYGEWRHVMHVVE